MMKKIFTLFLALTMAVGLLAGCGKKNAAETGESDSNKVSVVTTIFPEYDWVKEILGDKADNAEVTMLLSSGVDLHSYLQAFFRNQGVGSERECHRRTTRRAQRNARCDVEAEEEIQLQLYWLMPGILPYCLEAGGLLLLLRVCRRASRKKSG